MKIYKFKIAKKFKLSVVASSYESALDIVLNTELCPESCVKLIKISEL